MKLQCLNILCLALYHLYIRRKIYNQADANKGMGEGPVLRKVKTQITIVRGSSKRVKFKAGFARTPQTARG